MGKLHRGEDAELQGPVNILRGNDLEVLNAQAGVLPGIFLQQALVGVQHLVVGTVADGVVRDLIAVVVGQAHHVVNLLVRKAVGTTIARIVGVILQQSRAAGAQSTVAQHLDTHYTQMVVVQAVDRPVLPDVAGLGAVRAVEHGHGVNAQLQLTALIEILIVLDVVDLCACVRGRGKAIGEQLLLSHEHSVFLCLSTPGRNYLDDH